MGYSLHEDLRQYAQLGSKVRQRAPGLSTVRPIIVLHSTYRYLGSGKHWPSHVKRMYLQLIDYDRKRLYKSHAATPEFAIIKKVLPPTGKKWPIFLLDCKN